MRTNGIQHIFFDLDHTLWDFDRNSALTFEKIFKMNAMEIELESFLKIYEPLNLAYWKLYRENKIDKPSLRFRRLKDTFNALKMPVKAGLINKLAIDYIDHLSTFNHLFDGTVEILDYLCPNYTLHIITNGFREVQQGKLNNAKIDHYFNTVTNSEMVGAKKPDPRIFKHALERARADVSQSIMIGDNYEADILGALGLGFDVICFNYHKTHIENGIKTVDNLIELKQFL
ncbi:MAG: noncanonical pyrimidine nucleotidase, YjjG family [Flavobacteriaceae bacterium]|nr:YjjG family noncanonical pyrimidine nucleotidase [Bacteroidia bacterium]MBT8287923.1 YjjG family noncanonical pyrimidine nucleotidase [Bacteroidia bacterium]NNF74184.1 noncanonical pyrimidine nucleotidase, YjjG family [Flavobacteriaceae bacterium]NNK73634.1 noncanonical pyrimidine nucleotidase, YjjG family [Flavobacteriaceae bacterium]